MLSSASPEAVYSGTAFFKSFLAADLRLKVAVVAGRVSVSVVRFKIAITSNAFAQNRLHKKKFT